MPRPVQPVFRAKRPARSTILNAVIVVVALLIFGATFRAGIDCGIGPSAGPHYMLAFLGEQHCSSEFCSGWEAVLLSYRAILPNPVNPIWPHRFCALETTFGRHQWMRLAPSSCSRQRLA